jgi:hypothetical protein
MLIMVSTWTLKEIDGFMDLSFYFTETACTACLSLPFAKKEEEVSRNIKESLVYQSLASSRHAGPSFLDG